MPKSHSLTSHPAFFLWSQKHLHSKGIQSNLMDMENEYMIFFPDSELWSGIKE